MLIPSELKKSTPRHIVSLVIPLRTLTLPLATSTTSISPLAETFRAGPDPSSCQLARYRPVNTGSRHPWQTPAIRYREQHRAPPALVGYHAVLNAPYHRCTKGDSNDKTGRHASRSACSMHVDRTAVPRCCIFKKGGCAVPIFVRHKISTSAVLFVVYVFFNFGVDFCMMAERDLKHDIERRGSLVGVAEGLANEADAAVLGNFTHVLLILSLN